MNVYIKMSVGPKGSSRTARHLNEIVLTHYSQPNRRNPGVGSSVAMGSMPTYGDLEIGVDPHVEKEMCVFLSDYCLTGRMIPSAILSSEINEVGRPARTLAITLTNVTVTQFYHRKRIVIANLNSGKISWIYR